MDEVIVIGGGFAGLAAAVALAEAGRPVRLFERNPHLGGRARSFHDAVTGSVVDNGQHILMGCYRSTIRFLKTIGTLNKIQFQKRLVVRFLEPGGRLTELYCPGLPSPWHVLAGVLLSRSFSWKEKREVVRLGSALGAGRARPEGFEKMSVEDWLVTLGQSAGLRRNFWNLIAIAAMNEDPAVASAALFERVLRLALFTSPEDSRIGLPAPGLSECYTEAAERFIAGRGGKVEVGRGVDSILVEDGSVKAVKLSSAEWVEAAQVISAVPWHGLRIMLPPEILAQQLFAGLRRLEAAPIISICLWFDQAVTEIDFAGLRGTTIQWMFSKSGKLEGTPPYVALVLSGAHEHVHRSNEDLAAMAVRELRSLLPSAAGAKLIRSKVIKERFATFSPRAGSEGFRPAAGTPIRGLYLAGDWTATGLPATIEGAVQSGYAAAEALMRTN